MKTKFKYLYLLILLANKFYSQEDSGKIIEKTGFSRIEIKTKNDTIQIITSVKDKRKAKPTILFLQGSLPMPIVFYQNDKAKTLLPFDLKPYTDKFNFVMIARKGIPLVDSFENASKVQANPNNKAPYLYIKNNNLKYRTFQADKVIDYLYKQKWVQKNALYVVGQSEGSDIAAKVSEVNNKIAKLVCMSAGPFSRSTEFVLKARLKCISSNNDSVYQADIDAITKDVKNIADNIEEYKNDPQLYNWASYEKFQIYRSLEKFKKPILVTYGTEDIGSLYNDLLPFVLDKNKLTMKVYPDMDHNYFKKEFDKEGKPLEDSYHWDEVFQDVIEWIEK